VQACQARRAAIQFKERGITWRVRVQLDDHLRQLLRELGHAINDTVGESDRITGAISNVRSAGYDIVLKLDATIGLAKRDASSARLSNQDRRFLESLHIQVDAEGTAEEEETPAPKFDLTAQDVRFLKSLKISLENEA
jgi:hypothetical protein